MKINIKYRRQVLVLFAIITTVFLLVRCVSKKEEKKENKEPERPAVFEDYAGSQKCQGCHKDIYDKYIATAHHLTGLPATGNTIKGSFQKGKNDYWYSPSIQLSMQKRDSGFFQVAYFKGEEKKAMRFDIVIGSGKMGQSFLTWRGNRLYQLPITYFTEADQWSNSPGFPSEKVLIDRPVTSRCLECHATFARGISGTALEPAEFDHNRIIYEVGCEKCHGPAAKHVDFQTQHPEDKKGKYIVNPASLSKDLKLDMCALCHGGNIQKTKPSFEYTAGKKLADYFNTNTLSDVAVSTGNVDVHGNQCGLLQSSKCFKNSVNMTCSTCHNTHEKERGNKELFSQRCMSCHNTADAGFKTATHTQINNLEKNCIDCHMPAQPSRSIAVFLQGKETPVASLLRSHFIAIYPEETLKFKNQHSK